MSFGGVVFIFVWKVSLLVNTAAYGKMLKPFIKSNIGEKFLVSCFLHPSLQFYFKKYIGKNEIYILLI